MTQVAVEREACTLAAFGPRGEAEAIVGSALVAWFSDPECQRVWGWLQVLRRPGLTDGEWVAVLAGVWGKVKAVAGWLDLREPWPPAEALVERLRVFGARRRAKAEAERIANALGNGFEPMSSEAAMGALDVLYRGLTE